jgi:hypothetical protein
VPNSVYKQKDSKFYQAEIWIDGRRFSRTTRRTTEREAKTEANRIEKELKEKLGQQGAADDSLEINHVADRYMRHVGDHHAGRDNTERLVEVLVKYFGKTKDLRDITIRMRSTCGSGDARKPSARRSPCRFQPTR